MPNKLLWGGRSENCDLGQDFLNLGYNTHAVSDLLNDTSER